MIKVEELTVYDVEECSKMLNIHPNTVRRYVRSGKLKGQRVGGKWYVTADTLKEFIKGDAVNDSRVH